MRHLKFAVIFSFLALVIAFLCWSIGENLERLFIPRLPAVMEAPAGGEPVVAGDEARKMERKEAKKKGD